MTEWDSMFPSAVHMIRADEGNLGTALQGLRGNSWSNPWVGIFTCLRPNAMRKKAGLQRTHARLVSPPS